MDTVLRIMGIHASEKHCRAPRYYVDSIQGVSRTLGKTIVKRVWRWSYVLALMLLFGTPAGAAAHGRAYFFLSSSQVRALRNVAPAEILVLRWKKQDAVLEGKEPKPPDESGTLSLGPDYVSLEKAGGKTVIIDYALRRVFSFSAGRPDFSNDSLFAPIDFFDMEASNRAVQAMLEERLKMPHLPGHQRPLYEASLGVRTEGFAPLAVDVSRRGDEVSVRYKGEEMAQFRFGREELSPEQGEMLARALWILIPIHPAALEAVLPLRRLPVAIEAVHEFSIDSKARTSLQLEWVGTSAKAYPLPTGLSADLSYQAYSIPPQFAAFLKSVTDIALQAIHGTYGKPRPTLADFASAAALAQSKGDLLESGLAWLAAGLQYPEQMSACDTPGGPAYCAAYHTQLRAAQQDPQFRKIVQAAGDCTRRKWEQGARTLASVDVSGQPHGYVASMIMFCLTAGLPPKTLEKIDGMGTRYPLSASDNALNAIRANPYVPSYYYDIGVKFEMSYYPYCAWRMFDLGYALGGGTKGDAFDVGLRKREQYLLAHHPRFF